jgi:hypothetical protein
MLVSAIYYGITIAFIELHIYQFSSITCIILYYDFFH